MSGRYWLWSIRSNEAQFYAIGGRHWRCGTVPHTAKGKASRHGYCRYILTTQEIRENAANEHDEELRYHKVRLGRRANLPSVWDDPTVSALDNRNWKQFRRTRWK
jgi:hypothetical protein